MFSTGFDGSIYIYVLDKSMPFSTSISSRISYPKHKSWVTGFVIDSDQKLAYSISNDRSLKLWPLAIEELLSKN
jgi:WD40 repeat protein